MENREFNFEGAVRKLEGVINILLTKGEIIVAGDFNAKSRVWGVTMTVPEAGDLTSLGRSWR